MKEKEELRTREADSTRSEGETWTATATVSWISPMIMLITCKQTITEFKAQQLSPRLVVYLPVQILM